MVEKQPETILVGYVDDHRLIRETIVRFLEELGGIKVITQAENGRILFEKLAESNVLPHVCLVDLEMPEMDGFETVTRLRSEYNDMKILVLSGHISEAYFVQMLLAGADGYLTKKQSPEQIKQAVIDVHHLGFCNMEHFSPEFIKSIKNKENKGKRITLSATEVQLLKLSIEDKTYDEIAALMNPPIKSVEGHRNRLFHKLGVKTRAGLVMYAIQYGYVVISPKPRL